VRRTLAPVVAVCTLVALRVAAEAHQPAASLPVEGLPPSGDRSRLAARWRLALRSHLAGQTVVRQLRRPLRPRLRLRRCLPRVLAARAMRPKRRRTRQPRRHRPRQEQRLRRRQSRKPLLPEPLLRTPHLGRPQRDRQSRRPRLLESAFQWARPAPRRRQPATLVRKQSWMSLRAHLMRQESRSRERARRRW
jgi:hypothetical protein